MQFRSGGAGSFCKHGFDVHVYVLERAVPFEFARLDLLLDRPQSLLNFSAFGRAYDSSTRERCGVRD